MSLRSAIYAPLQNAIRRKRIFVSEHAVAEAWADGLTDEGVVAATLGGEVIEDYPGASPNPRCLVLGRTDTGNPIHSVWAYEAEKEIAVLVTCWDPSLNPGNWSPDFRKRMKR